MPGIKDGPSSSSFAPLPLKGNMPLAKLADLGISVEMSAAVEHAPSGDCVGWGIRFEIGDVIVIKDHTVTIELGPTLAQWLVFMHTSDRRQVEPGPDGFFSPMRGQGQLGEHTANYIMIYQDGTEERVAIRRRHQIGAFQRFWGENCFESVAHHKPRPVRAAHEQLGAGWGWTQTRVSSADSGPWVNWLWAWENPHPETAIVGLRFEPVSGIVIVCAVSAGQASSLPLRWRRRRKACLTLPEGESFQPDLDEHGLLNQIQLDLGQVVSATSRLVYPHHDWAATYNNQLLIQSAHGLTRWPANGCAWFSPQRIVRCTIGCTSSGTITITHL